MAVSRPVTNYNFEAKRPQMISEKYTSKKIKFRNVFTILSR